MPPNPKLEAAVALHRFHAQVRYECTGHPVRWFTSVRYQTRTWPRPRRVLAMIEHTAQGPNVRFVVTNRRGRAADVFAWYHQRGQAENFIKELKRDLAADRLSCHAFHANAFRLLLHALAYDLLHLFRLRTLAGTPPPSLPLFGARPPGVAGPVAAARLLPHALDSTLLDRRRSGTSVSRGDPGALHELFGLGRRAEPAETLET